MSRQAFDGFSIELPAGWSDVLEDQTFSDPDAPPPITFAPARGAGAFYVVMPHVDPDEPPGATVADVEEMARAWGERRGIASPLAAASEARADASIATAVYRLNDDFVQLWVLSNGSDVIVASYVCPWSARYDDQATREALAASLRFA